MDIKRFEFEYYIKCRIPYYEKIMYYIENYKLQYSYINLKTVKSK